MEFLDSLNATDEAARRHKAREAIAAGVLPDRGEEPPVRKHYRLHMRCFAAWEFERASMSETRHATAARQTLKEAHGDGTMRARERSTDTPRGTP